MTIFSRFLALVSTVIFAFGANAQITFEYMDLPVAGDEILRHVDTLPLYGPGGDGPLQIWDFSSAMDHVQETTTVSTAAATPYASSFTGSNLASTTDGSTYAYYNAAPQSFISTGFAGELLGDGQVIVVPFSPDLLLHSLPRNYTDSFSDDYAFEAEADGDAFGVHSVRLRHYGQVADTTDAYGLITTPIGTYDALRVRTTDTTVDSIWIKLIVFSPWTFVQSMEGTATTYSWLAKETKLPVAEMAMDTLGNAIRFTYSSIEPDLSTAIRTNEARGVTLYPVPAINDITIAFSTPGSYSLGEVFSADGRSVATIAFGQNDNHRLPVQGWPSGIYTIRLVSTDALRMDVIRFVVQ